MIDLTKYSNLQLPEEIVSKLYVFIDLQKLTGLNMPEASAKFEDYIRFLQLPETEELAKFFLDRWTDHRVRIKVPQDYKKYIHTDHPMFTPPRIEQLTDTEPYYKLGIRDRPGALKYNPMIGGNVQVAQPPQEDYSYFIIDEYVPEQFYIMLPNEEVQDVLENGFPATDYNSPYSLTSTVEEAKSGYVSAMSGTSRKMSGNNTVHEKLNTGVVIAIDAEALELNDNVLYTEKYGAHKVHRTHGYYYVGAIPAKACKVAV
jgi:hypothetical protein